MTKLGRWVYCKYCYRNARPEIGPDGSLVVCSKCGAGLAPLDRVQEAGSLTAWYEQITLEFVKAFAR
jgi:hypothetical protein